LAPERIRLLRRRGVETVILAGADTHGIMRGKRLPIAELPRAAEHGVALCEVIWALPVDERQPVQRPPGHAGYFPRDGYPDMLALPDLGTARIVPWHDRTALLLCDFVDRDGGAVPVSPRAVLRSVVARAQSMGIEPVVGVELEFYLLRETPRSVADKRPAQLVAVDERPSVYGVVAASRSEPFAGAVRDTLREYGLAVEACNLESGPGQFEINLRAAPALQAADEAFLLKSAVKEIAARQGLLATFMAKPRSDWPGSSCHLHLSLRGADLRHFIGGLLEGMAELTAIFAPTPNSYRRFAPYSWAGTTATWGVDNRSAGVRAIGDTRVEHRQAGADANPYLAAAAALAAGLDGVRRRREPPPAVDGDVYALADSAVPALPATLAEATDLLERSALARDWLGDDVVDHCVAMRREELATQAAAVTDWEIERYLEAL
jgi:glutamine synthetase